MKNRHEARQRRADQMLYVGPTVLRSVSLQLKLPLVPRTACAASPFFKNTALKPAAFLPDQSRSHGVQVFEDDFSLLTIIGLVKTSLSLDSLQFIGASPSVTL